MKNFFVYSYPRYVNENWLSGVINMDATMDISMFIYPHNSADVLKMLRKKTSQMRSTMNMLRDK
jgi:conjugal transfer ATP-binding protein TraC